MLHRTIRITFVATLVASSACAPDTATAPPPGAPAANSATSPDSPPAIAFSNRLAYAWADQPTAASYTPNLSYAFNYTFNPISIERFDVGHYGVDFTGLSHATTGGNEMVVTSAYGSSNIECLPTFWFSALTTTKLTVRVDCVDRRTRVHADSRFTILAVGNTSLPARSAFTLAHLPTSPVYTPDPSVSYTSSGLPMKITHNPSPGDWLVDLGTGTPRNSVFLVNSHDVQFSCTLGEFKSVGVRVRCFDGAGVSANSQFHILQVQGSRLGQRMGYAFTDQPTNPSYTPNPAFSVNSKGGAITATRSSVGHYKITFGNLQRTSLFSTENVQVTAIGTSYVSCNVINWASLTASLRVTIQCRNKLGVFTDARY